MYIKKCVTKFMNILQFRRWYWVIDWWTRGHKDVVCTQGVLFFWAASAKLRKATIGFVMSVCPHGATGLTVKEFSWNLLFWGFFRKSFEKIRVSLKSNRTNGYSTWRLVHAFGNFIHLAVCLTTGPKASSKASSPHSAI